MADKTGRCAECPLDDKGVCAEHGSMKWTIGILLTIGAAVVAFSWQTAASVGDVKKDLAVVSFAAAQSEAMFREIREDIKSLRAAVR